MGRLIIWERIQTWDFRLSLFEVSGVGKARAEGIYPGTLPLDRVDVLGSVDGVTTSIQRSQNSRPSMLDHQDKYMMKSQVHVSKSFAISDIQALPRRKPYCQIYQVVKLMLRGRLLASFLDHEHEVMEMIRLSVTEDEITMAQALAALKSVKPKVVVQEQEMSTTIPAAATIVTTVVPTLKAKGVVFHEQKQSQIPTISSLKDKGKAKIIEPEVPLKKKEQMRIDEEYARKLQAEEQKLARLKKSQQDEEANNSWDNIQAMMDADRLLAERLQAREREEFSKVQKARLLVELIEKRKKHFAALRAQEKRSKPPTKTQMKSQMSTYLRHIGGYKQSHLKGRSFDEIKEQFDKEMIKVNNFIAMDLKAQESSTKRIAEHLESDISKKQKVDENVELAIDDFKELRKCIEIVLDDGDEMLIEATPISSISPTIIDYEIYKEGKKNYFKIIKADVSAAEGLQQLKSFYCQMDKDV
nr:hypothetical protein [Tanacetum cinerariifolium]